MVPPSLPRPECPNGAGGILALPISVFGWHRCILATFYSGKTTAFDKGRITPTERIPLYLPDSGRPDTAQAYRPARAARWRYHSGACWPPLSLPPFTHRLTCFPDGSLLRVQVYGARRHTPLAPAPCLRARVVSHVDLSSFLCAARLRSLDRRAASHAPKALPFAMNSWSWWPGGPRLPRRQKYIAALPIHL